MKKILIIYIGLIVITSCTTTSETRTTKITKGMYSESGIIYALPRANLVFDIEASKTEIIPGPYYEFAEKYLGLENVPEKRETIWNINNIEISTYRDLDPEQYYIIEPSGKMNVDFNKLFKNGTVLPVNKSIESNFPNAFYGKSGEENEIVFIDLSVTKYVGQEKITYYKRVQRDSLFAKVPVTETKSVYKSFAEKAEEAANLIFLIREKRIELLTGMADFYPEGGSMHVALEELNRLENNYLELFIGKRFASNYSALYEFTPTLKELEQPYILFRFNEEKGLLSANDLTGRPIIIELQKSGQTKNLSYLMADQVNREGVDYKNKLYYRVPDLAQVKVYDGNTMLATRKVKIEQYGEVMLFPAMFLMGDEQFIEFYREDE